MSMHIGGMRVNGLAAPSCRPKLQRLAAVRVHANKLIKGANRPVSSKKAGKKSQFFELNLQKLCTDAEYLPQREIGPVEVAVKAGRGRCVLAKEDLRPGSLLFVSQPVGPALVAAQMGQQLQPQDLLAHWQAGSQKLTAADRFKLSLLHRPGSPPAAVSFKDFSDDKASSKAKKAAASSKGFGAPAAAAKQPGAAAAAGATELSPEQLELTLNCNAYGDDHLDGGLTSCRKEQQASIIGVWPEFALLNHSCAPNTTSPVLLKDRLLLRTATAVPAGEELTTCYLAVAGGVPLAQRRQLLQPYGFSCNCPRCKAEEAAPADVQATLQAAHQWSSSIDTPQLLQAMANGDTAAVQQIHDKASSFVEQLEQQLEQVAEPVAVTWLKGSAYDTHALLIRTADWLVGSKHLQSAQSLADLVRVFAPASEPHLMLLADSAARAAEAAAAGQQVAPGESEQLRVQRFVQTLNLRYGEFRAEQLELLKELAGASTSALGPHWLGLVDVSGRLGLDQLVKAAGEPAAAGEAAAAGGKRKVELTLEHLGLP